MRIKLGENLGTRGAALLRSEGMDVATVVEQGLASCPDRAVIEVCRAEARALVSLDLDFANPMVFPPDRYAGIIVLRLSSPVTREAIDAALSTFAAAAKERSFVGRLWIVERSRIREYQPSE